MTPDTRTCNKCLQVKPYSEFNKNSWAASGYKSHCKVCTSNYSKQWYAENSDKHKEASRKHYLGYRVGKKKPISDKYDVVKARAHAAMSNEFRGGKVSKRITKKPCEVCNEAKSEFHHTNGYEKPNWFVGAWLCRTHHAKAHVKMREEVK